LVAKVTLGSALVAALLGFVATAAIYREHRDIVVDFERGYEGAFVEDFHPRERAEGKFFRWTTGESYLDFRHVPATGNLSVEAKLKTIRPAGTPLPELAFTANGVTVHRARALPGIVTYHFDFPSQSSRLRLGIESETFEAGGGRVLGVQVLEVRLSLPKGSASWIVPSLWMAIAGAILALAFAATRVQPWLATGCSLVTVVGFAYLLAQQSVRFTNYPREVALLAVALLAVGSLASGLLTRIGWLHRSERGWVLALCLMLLLVKLAVVGYPLMLSSDADFQANRMSELLARNWHPTSVTQHEPPFRIPYPVSLYVVTAPLAKLGLDRVSALEITTVFFDVLISAALVFLGWRFLDDLRAGLLAGAIYALVPMNGLSLSAGNFTNLFAVSMLALAFTFLVIGGTGGDRRAVAALAITTLAALTAHFGMLLEAVVLFPLWLAAVWLLPAPVKDERRFLSLAVLAAFVVAGLYYLGYWDLIASQWERAIEGDYAAAALSGPGEKLSFNLAMMGEQLGWVFLLTALLGAVGLGRGLTTSLFQALAALWIVVTLLFFGIDLLSAIEIRYLLQALPILALLSGSYLSRALDRGPMGRVAASAATLYLVGRGLFLLRDVALYRYH
jgi:hypothetical protein